MRQILLMMVLVALVGCGKKEPAQPSASKPEPTKDKTTAGTKLWEFETGGDVGSSPAIGSDGTVYVGSVDGKLYAIDGKTAIGSDGTVYVGEFEMARLESILGVLLPRHRL